MYRTLLFAEFYISCEFIQYILDNPIHFLIFLQYFRQILADF